MVTGERFSLSAGDDTQFWRTLLIQAVYASKPVSLSLILYQIYSVMLFVHRVSQSPAKSDPPVAKSSSIDSQFQLGLV